MKINVSNVWESLRDDVSKKNEREFPIYRALGESAKGLRACYVPVEDKIELLVEVPKSWALKQPLPKWRGMRFEVTSLSLPPRKESEQLRLILEADEHESVFINFCEDLVKSLENVPSEKRLEEIEQCIERWSSFFEKCGPDGLSLSRQLGLYAELFWLKTLLDEGVRIDTAVRAWKGSEKGYHDFDIEGNMLEVKATLKKEPRFVKINNERQLDDRKLKSLHLFVLTLHISEGNGETLPQLVDRIKDCLKNHPMVAASLERKLINAGYLSKQSNRYSSFYIEKKEELFNVRMGFPRIIELPDGIGNLQYSLTLSACTEYLSNPKTYINNTLLRRN